MAICRMTYNKLNNWLNNKPQHGDVAYLIEPITDKRYIYVYRGPDSDPYSHLISDQFAADWSMKEVDKLKVKETEMDKRCDNCKYFNSVTFSKIRDFWCSHEKHSGIRVAAHTSCPEHEPKEVKTTPFDGMKFYLKDTNTGELCVKYICEDCSKEMLDAPDRWWLVLPVNDRPKRKPGYHFRCSECDKKKEGKI